ncbi:DUF2987 domain-containing protein [Oceanimonas doudoroffii]|uniref:DUF2987 domain-containing protein n=1 Tax=Oceanimonas doudoroffii TaxID=84158 RepID=A0A233RGK2_9GAMM|nr:DUF2987 domain-containing protein [Oceanimonas doudoroffii]OXY82516.1 hypothetical protein B6S08_03040 [Oceanimonas doudoroffii]
MKSVLFGAALALLAVPAHADALNLGYSGFYKHLDTVADAEVEHATLGFYLSRNDGEGWCTIHHGSVEVVGQPRGEVTVLPHGEFVLPFDKQLDLDKAVVRLDVDQPERCEISIQIQTLLPAGEVQAAQLRAIRDEMQALLQEMAGWPGRYFVPSIKGVQLQPLSGQELIQGLNKLSLDDAALTGNGNWQIPATRVTPWL